MSNAVFDVHGADQLVEMLRSEIHAPYVNAYKSMLGGAHKVSVLVAVGLDSKDTWKNGIFENSRYFKLHIENSGVIERVMDSGLKGRWANNMMEHVALSKRFRKTKFKSLDEVVEKINKYIEQVA